MLVSSVLCGVNLIWDRNSETNVVGYRVYMGEVSRGYDSVIDVGNSITATLLERPNVTNYFAVTAYDSEGLESRFSDEVTYFTPTNATTNVVIIPTNTVAQLKSSIRKTAQNQLEICFDAKADIEYTVELTMDFINWYQYLTTSRQTDSQVIIPLPTVADKMFFKVTFNPN